MDLRGVIIFKKVKECLIYNKELRGVLNVICGRGVYFVLCVFFIVIGQKVLYNLMYIMYKLLYKINNM